VEMAPADLKREIDELTDEYRRRCLWFLREGYYPATQAEQLRVLDAVARHGDAAGFRRAKALRLWLSPPTSAGSSGS